MQPQATLRLAASNRRPTPSTVSEKVDEFCKMLEGVPRAKAMEFMRPLGVQGSAEPTNAEFAAARLHARAELTRIYRTEETYLRTTGTATMEEALAVTAQWQASHVEFQRLQKEIASFKQGREYVDVLKPAIASAKAGGKLTPAEERAILLNVGLGEMTIKGAAQWLASKSAHPALANAHRREGAAGVVFGARWHGKAYAELSGSERARLKRDDSDLFEIMRSEWVAEGRPAKPGAA